MAKVTLQTVDEKCDQQMAKIEELEAIIGRLGSELGTRQLITGEIGLEVAILRTEFNDLKKMAKLETRSSRIMTEDDARRVVLGDLASKTPKEAALLLGLSYGQVYSARGGYTFKEIFNERERLKRAEK
jgi:hypothetical protein